MRDKNLLITLWFADKLHGGLKYSAEIGEYFRSLGYDVYVCGVVTTDVAKTFFAKRGITLINIAHFPTDIVFDLIWAHHWPVVPFLIYKGMRYKKLINSTISNILLIERPIWFIENIDMNIVLTNNTKNMFIQNYNMDGDKIVVLPNTAPDEYFNYCYNPGGYLNSIAVVSNHPPEEVLDALNILQKSIKCKVIVYGAGNPVDITPKILAKHDVIISIGKTVQYALAMGIPVYNYDHFGGSGYITTKNIEKEGQHNFSGRSFFTKKTAKQIAYEIMQNYQSVRNEQHLLKNIAIQQYKLSARINNILDKLNNTPVVKHVQINNTNLLLFEYCATFIDFCASHNGRRLSIGLSQSDLVTEQKQNQLKRFFKHLKKLSF